MVRLRRRSPPTLYVPGASVTVPPPALKHSSNAACTRAVASAPSVGAVTGKSRPPTAGLIREVTVTPIFVRGETGLPARTSASVKRPKRISRSPQRS